MVRNDIYDFLKTIPSNVTLVAATKYVQSDDMVTLLENGVSNFGENRVDDFLDKYQDLSGYPITWHFIGHLQRNKALKVINKIDYLHSLDSLELAQLINSHRKTPLPCFIEVSVNHEVSKNGVPYENVSDFIKSILPLPNIKLVGLMMMAIKSSSDGLLKEQFHRLRVLRDEMAQKYNISLPYLSMGMSEDYQEAISEGATHIRLGRILFDEL